MCYLCSFVSAIYDFVCANFFLFLCVAQSTVILLTAASPTTLSGGSASDDNSNVLTQVENLQSGTLVGALGARLEEVLGASAN